MESKPAGWHRRYAEWFDDATVVASYRHRPEYPSSLFARLAALARDGHVLDAGCGPGDLARHLAPLVRQVDAVDLSERMVAEGRSRSGGDAANLTWLAGPIEDAPLSGPYDLVVAGDSVHWFDWVVVMPRFARLLTPRGRLAIVTRDWFRAPEIAGRLGPVYRRYGANPDFRPLDPIVELERRQLFSREGRYTTAPAPWRPSVDEVIGCHQSQNGFDVERMSAADATAFARAVREALLALVEEGHVVERQGRLELDVTATVVWGWPGSSSAA